jgi:hypothetical protein
LYFVSAFLIEEYLRWHRFAVWQAGFRMEVLCTLMLYAGTFLGAFPLDALARIGVWYAVCCKFIVLTVMAYGGMPHDWCVNNGALRAAAWPRWFRFGWSMTIHACWNYVLMMWVLSEPNPYVYYMARLFACSYLNFLLALFGGYVSLWIELPLSVQALGGLFHFILLRALLRRARWWILRAEYFANKLFGLCPPTRESDRASKATFRKPDVGTFRSALGMMWARFPNPQLRPARYVNNIVANIRNPITDTAKDRFGNFDLTNDDWFDLVEMIAAEEGCAMPMLGIQISWANVGNVDLVADQVRSHFQRLLTHVPANAGNPAAVPPVPAAPADSRVDFVMLAHWACNVMIRKLALVCDEEYGITTECWSALHDALGYENHSAISNEVLRSMLVASRPYLLRYTGANAEVYLRTVLHDKYTLYCGAAGLEACACIASRLAVRLQKQGF